MAVLGAVLAASLGASGASAQTVDCPCFSSGQLDSWFEAVANPPDQSNRKLLCVDDPGFTTFDMLEKADPGGLVYLDVTFGTSNKPARCLVEVSGLPSGEPNYKAEVFNFEASACRTEIVQSQTWASLSCPNN